ncbi:hypothetical protein A2V71_00505 [Candidatus Berkelbacteria bacterium RBG_13_40_8]|uniref:Uncharacterized protein n=1 Tax=Candidatus Berkelbacteria bacterium RBG_13_40_8 TaxID=1797467 RepID=A0A1F5DQA0_9BACT|nr:MAG: hypothetical protein A2V71_00505 [Candidatus Berkelbacteria bacterium RBG_13_40_8]
MSRTSYIDFNVGAQSRIISKKVFQNKRSGSTKTLFRCFYLLAIFKLFIYGYLQSSLKIYKEKIDDQREIS